MILGIGIDVASIARMDRALERYGERFWARILTPDERADLVRRTADRGAALAGRFAAKEAASKALGAPRDVWWHDLEVRRSELGAPTLHLAGAAAAHGARLGVVRCHLSITHDAGVAVAVVVLEGGPS
ncbi:MAG: holo-ACP synthase [Polyangiaceae bacterium]|nr:holo-ACP synthase [Polyangiaceae bacterium]